MNKIQSVKVAFAMACLFLAAACSDNFNQVALPSGKTIATLATENADLNILVAALTKTGLASTFANNNSGAFTVFAPTDAAFVAYFNSLGGAFATLDEAGVINWINTTLSPTSATLNIGGLTTVLLYHVVNSEIPFSKVTGAQGLVTLSGSARISISKVGSNVVLNANRAGFGAGNGAQSVILDTDASNGVIHTIDKVLIPVSVANIWAGTSPAAAPVVNLPGFTVNYAVSPPAVSVFGTVMPRTGSGGSINVATAAVGTLNDYNLISAAIARAELATTIITIATPFPDFTLFAPTDAAFQAFLATLPNTGTPVTTEATARDFINTLSPSVLAGILRYHVVPGRVVSTDLSNGQVVTTALAGGTFTVNIAGSVITLVDKNTGVADPTVTSANNLTNAGVLHRIDGVLRSN
jgi:transforming growth factor-beta-induced protein